MGSIDAPASGPGASQPCPPASQQQGQAQNMPFTFALVHRPKSAGSDSGAPNNFETEHTDVSIFPSPTEETTAPAPATAPTTPPPQKHITPTTAAITVTSILRNSHSRYSQEQFDEESVHGDGDDRNGDEHYDGDGDRDDRDLGFALDVDLEHDYVLARGGGSSSNRPMNKSNWLSGRTKRHIPVKGGGAFTRKVQHRRIGNGGRCGSGMNSGIGRATGGAPLAADGFDLNVDFGGMPVVPYAIGINARLEPVQSYSHHRVAHQHRIHKGRLSVRHRPAGRFPRQAGSLFSFNHELPAPPSPALHYITAHSVWTSLRAIPGFSFPPRASYLFQEHPGASNNSDALHSFVRLLSTILADPAIICKCDKSTCRGRNSGLPQFLVVLFTLAPTLHAWPWPSDMQIAQPSQSLPWHAFDTTEIDFEDHQDVEDDMPEIGIDEIGDMAMDMDMQDTATATDDVERYRSSVAAPAFSPLPELASHTDTPFWAWLAENLFEQYATSDDSGEDDACGNNEHARGWMDKTRPSWITNTYVAPDVGHKVFAIMQTLVDARRLFLAEEAQRKNESNGSRHSSMEDDRLNGVDAWNLLADMPTRLAGERSQTHPCRWGTPLTCKDPICYQGDLATPMSCCDLHDQRVGLAVDLWCLWLNQGRRTLGQPSSDTDFTQPAQKTEKALVEWARRLESRDAAHNSATDGWHKKR